MIKAFWDFLRLRWTEKLLVLILLSLFAVGTLGLAIERKLQRRLRYLPLLLFGFLLPACTTFELSSSDLSGGAGDPDTAKAMSRLITRNADMIGTRISVEVSPHGIAKLEIEGPQPGVEYPKEIVQKWDRKGILREYSERPFLAQINATNPLRVIWENAGSIIRNVAGTVASAIVGGNVVTTGVQRAP